jgi:hypothetical protein
MMIALLHMPAPLQWMQYKTLVTDILVLQCHLHRLHTTYSSAI